MRVSPFPLALDDPGSALAVKGPLRRFAPLTAPGRSGRRAVYEGKEGYRSASDFVSHLIAFDSYRWRCAQKDTTGWIFGLCLPGRKGTFRPYQPP